MTETRKIPVSIEVGETRWWPVTERMPPKKDRYLTVTEEGYTLLNLYSGEQAGDWWDSQLDAGLVLMWADVPARPDWKLYAQPILNKLRAEDDE